MENSQCPVCGFSLTEPPQRSVLGTRVQCPRCGQFELFGELGVTIEAYLSNASDKMRAILSHNIRSMQQDHKPVSIDTSCLESLLAIDAPPRPSEQADNLIRWLGETTEPGQEVGVGPPHQSIVGSTSVSGFELVVRHLYSRGLIGGTLSSPKLDSAKFNSIVHLTIAGWDYYFDLQEARSDSRVAFMAMKFGDASLDKMLAEVFRPAVAMTGFELRRLDDNPKAGLIDDRLRVEIRNSRFLIADLSHGNLGAYWEAGFAEGLGVPVIYTCRKDVFDDEKTHFDTNHHLTVVWDELEPSSCAEALKATIRATLPAEARMED